MTITPKAPHRGFRQWGAMVAPPKGETMMIDGMMTLRKVQAEVREIMRLSCEPDTHWEAENAERALCNEFVRWVTTIAPDQGAEAREIAVWIAKCFELNFMRNYSGEDTNG